MNARVLFISAAVIAIIAAGLHHERATRLRSQLEAERQRQRAEIADTQRLAEETSRQLSEARRELQALAESRRAASPSKPMTATVSTPPSAQPPKSNVGTMAPELREIHVRAFVGDQRLRFSAMLKRLGFTPEKVQAFDRIQTEYQHAMTKDWPSAEAKLQATQTRDAQLRELFGADYHAWTAANLEQPVRSIVNQIVQQTFPSSGALTTAQADELTRIVGAHRSPADRGPARYDWDRIIADARGILDDRQSESFAAAIRFRRTTEQMTAMAGNKPP
jgi:hypothetical protein